MNFLNEHQETSSIDDIQHIYRQLLMFNIGRFKSRNSSAPYTHQRQLLSKARKVGDPAIQEIVRGIIGHVGAIISENNAVLMWLEYGPKCPQLSRDFRPF